MTSLTEISKRYKSDKLTDHNFISVYEEYFEPIRFSSKKIFEIGIYEGESHKIWEEYFENATIYGIDIYDKSSIETNRIKTFVADQGDTKDLQLFINKFGGDFDVIIDDGSHMVRHQQISLGFLFQHLRSGGLYICEDLHTSLKEFPDHKFFGCNDDFSNTTYKMLSEWAPGKISSKYLGYEQTNYLCDYIKDCKVITSAHHGYRHTTSVLKKV